MSAVSFLRRLLGRPRSGVAPRERDLARTCVLAQEQPGEGPR
jgi:hypothetical protein